MIKLAKMPNLQKLPNMPESNYDQNGRKPEIPRFKKIDQKG